MSEEYVSHETFEATMKEIRALMKASEAENRRVIDVIQADMRASEARHEKIIAEIRGDVKAINTKVEGFADTFTIAIGDMKDTVNKIWMGLGIVIAFCTIVITAVTVLR